MPEAETFKPETFKPDGDSGLTEQWHPVQVPGGFLVSMSEPRDVWDGHAKLLSPHQVSAAIMNRTDGPHFMFIYCLPAFHHPDTTVDHEIMEHTGMTSGPEVTDELSESAASIVFDQARNRVHTIKAIPVETLGSN